MTDVGFATLAAGPAARQATGLLRVRTRGSELRDITREAAVFVAGSGIGSGLASFFCRHTSASLVIQENADPDVRRDLLTALDRLAPRDGPWVHADEGPDDMPGHVRAMLTGVSLSVPVLDGRLALGTWQGIYLVEHRDRPHEREVLLHVSGE